MNLQKLPTLLLVSAAFATASSVAQAAMQTIHNGDAYIYGGFGANIGTVDTTTFESGPSSLRLDYSGTFQNSVFRATDTLQPGLVNWAEDTLSFDYQTTSVSAIYRFRVHVSSLGNLVVVDVTYPTGLPLVADGEWNTVTLTGANWTAAYDNAVNNTTIDPNNSYPLLIAIQNLTTSGSINIDNIRIGSASAIPEPSSFALLAAAGAGVVAATRRRRRA